LVLHGGDDAFDLLPPVRCRGADSRDADLLRPKAGPGARSPDRGREVRIEHVGGADEVGDEAGLRPLVDIGGRADLHEPALIEDGHPVGHGKSLALVVGDEDERDPELLLQRLQLDLHPLAELQVERPERLVEEQHFRAVDERASERHALPLAARQLTGPPLLHSAELHERKRDARLDFAVGSRNPLHH
jgi:hypothetical protein